MKFPSERGFHLVELVIAVLIVGILLALALPSYHSYRIRADRADAVRLLAQAAQCQEELRAVNGAYDTTQCLPGEASRTYRFSITPANVEQSDVYTLNAMPISEDVGKPCGTLSVDQFGTRSISGAGSTVMDCWGGR